MVFTLGYLNNPFIIEMQHKQSVFVWRFNIPRMIVDAVRCNLLEKSFAKIMFVEALPTYLQIIKLAVWFIMSVHASDKQNVGKQ